MEALSHLTQEALVNRSTPRLALAAVSALVLSLGLAACGGDSDSDSDGGSADAPTEITSQRSTSSAMKT